MVCAALCALSTMAAAQSFPAKTIHLVVPLPPGTATDIVARTLAGPVGQALGQTVIVDNKAGADGAIAGAEVVKAAPDGYTLFLATNSPMSAVPALRKTPPYDPTTDFTPITDVGRFTFFVVVHPSMPANTLAELITFVKANPGKLNYATGNTTGIVTMAYLRSEAGLQLVHVPYKGEPQALTDLVSGRVHMMVASATSAIPHAKDGTLRILATASPRRSPAAPDVPSLAETGFPQFELTSWAGLFGPPKMPKDIVDQLNRVFVSALGTPEVRAALEKQAFALSASTPQELSQLVRTQLENYKQVLAAAGVQPE
jgi:tripartite-type tricarboxylate transporter receptor subunit TctC